MSRKSVPLDAARQFILEAKSIVLTTHQMPDGDGLGAEVALFHLLKQKTKKVHIFNADGAPGRYDFLGDILKNPENQLKAIEQLSSIDLLLCVDTSSVHRIGSVWDHLKKRVQKIVFLDHHPKKTATHVSSLEEHKESGDFYEIVDESSSCIGELIYRIFDLETSNRTLLTPDVAQALYVSLVTDTNSFRYSKTNALAHKIAAHLFEKGVKAQEIYQSIYSSKSVAHLQLIGKALSGVQTTPDQRVAWVSISQKELHVYGAEPDDTESIINFLFLLKSPSVILFFREESDGTVKVSFRSKTDVNVQKIALTFGGGGHFDSAGCKVPGSLSAVELSVVQEVLRQIGNS